MLNRVIKISRESVVVGEQSARKWQKNWAFSVTMKS